MSPHVHIGFIHFFIGWLGIVMLFGPLWRWASSQLKDTPLGKAMAFIY